MKSRGCVLSQAINRSSECLHNWQVCHNKQLQIVLVTLLLLVANALHAAEGNAFGSSIDFAMYRLATEQNDPSAQYLVGNNYLEGKTVNKDYLEAVQWFEKAAKQGHKKAQYQLGKMYLYGTGIDKNYPFALEFLQKAAENRHVQAQFELGNYYMMGGSGVVEYTNAITWYRRAAGQHHRMAMLELGKLLYEQRGEEQLPGEALKLLKRAADAGEHEASKYLRKVKNGEIRIAKAAPAIAPQPQRAPEEIASLNLSGKSESTGSASSESQFRLAMTYLEGDGVDKDPIIAARLLRKAADNKHARAQYQLALLYRDGIGVEKSPNDAEIWLTHAAENGFQQAKAMLEKEDRSAGKISPETLALGETQYRLGLNFLNGTGGLKDAELAARWLVKAAKQNHAPSKYQLGLMYRDGVGVAVNKQTAKRWFKSAAEQGEARAEVALQTIDDPAAVQPEVLMAESTSAIQSQEFTGRQTRDDSPVSRVVMNNVVNHKPQPPSEPKDRTGKNNTTSSPTQNRAPTASGTQSPLMQAAIRGDAEAQYKLGMNYIQGSMVEKDIDKGMDWISKAADNHHLDAQLHIASMYLNGGHKVTRDVSQAVKWYELAAESGDADAQFNLGEMYQKGVGLEKSNTKAIKWFRKAANQGHKTARNRLGGCRIC